MEKKNCPTQADSHIEEINRRIILLPEIDREVRADSVVHALATRPSTFSDLHRLNEVKYSPTALDTSTR